MHEDVLAWINRERQARGMPTIAEMPKGRRGSGYHCPVARGMSGSSDWYCSAASHGTYDPFDGSFSLIEHPRYVNAFINAFDDGEYPDLIESE